VFEELQQDGPDHSRSFAYQVIIDERIFDKGTGASKAKAKKAAALNALNELYNMPIQMRTYCLYNTFFTPVSPKTIALYFEIVMDGSQNACIEICVLERPNCWIV